MLKLTDSLKTGSRVFFLIVVFFVLIGFSKCTNVIFTNGSAKKTCVQKIMFRIVNKYIHSFFFSFFFRARGGFVKSIPSKHVFFTK